jgi:hypothetical protein
MPGEAREKTVTARRDATNDGVGTVPLHAAIVSTGDGRTTREIP